MKRFVLSFLVAGVLAVACPLLPAQQFVAYSLQAAERLAKTNQWNTEADRLGGMTDLSAVVYDADTSDVILVGIAEPGKDPLWLDSFVAALRAVKVGLMPEVSIELPVAGSGSGQPVEFKGQLANTRLGSEMLDADLLLKHLALGKVSTEVWGLPSYLSLAAAQAKRENGLPAASTRFWLSVGDMETSGTRDDAAVLVQKSRIDVKSELAMKEGKTGATLSDEYARHVAEAFPELALQFPAFYRVQPIVKMVCLAKNLLDQGMTAGLNYWLDEYRLPSVPTPPFVDLEENRRELAEIGRVLVLTGGFQIDPQIRRLNRGDAAVLHQIVLAARPNSGSLLWNPPLRGWNITGTMEYSTATSTGKQPGCTLQQELRPLNQVPAHPSLTVAPPKLSNFTSPMIPVLNQTRPSPPVHSNDLPGLNPPRRTSPPEVPHQNEVFRQSLWQPPTYARNVGGVMLSGMAVVEGAEGAQVDLSREGFALVVEGNRAELAPEAFRRFVTALWAVYFSDQDPGISIDPISPKIDKHLVRYIGNVVNTDLGRVMREADYQMKKWAVGTERAQVSGFKNPDDFIAEHGLQVSGAYSRFWFVPEGMTFRRAGNMLLFSGGRMTVKTEYLAEQGLAAHAEPANERFAAMFTEQYDRIALSYPVYQELFEYAKLVSLAKYLKNSGVPLLWFLVANKDLVLTEDSPGTVDALAHGSNYYRNLTMSGGVDLKTGGSYVYDAEAMAALQQAMAHPSPAESGRSTLASAPTIAPAASQPFSFDVGKNSYSVIPQHSLTTGKDPWGNRYQTDMAVRNGGKPGLELVRYFDAQQTAASEFGKGWKLLVPYRIRPSGDETRVFLNVRVPVRMAIENLLTGRKEVLTFSTDRYSIAGYVPDKLEASQLVGLFLIANATFRLADKFGNEFWFDPSGSLTDMLFTNQDRIHYDYLSRPTNAFEQPPFEIRPAGAETVEYRGATLPKHISVRDTAGHSGEETLVFDLTQDVATYFPADETASRYQCLRWTADGGYRLEDKQGNLVAFNKEGQFDTLAPVLDSDLIRTVSMGGQKIDMTYAVTASGRLVIAKAALTTGDEHNPQLTVRYHYNDDGTLARAEQVGTSKTVAMNRKWASQAEQAAATSCYAFATFVRTGGHARPVHCASGGRGRDFVQ